MAINYTQKQIDILNEAIENHFPRVTKASLDMTVTHEGISRLVMLDRYSQRDSSLKSLVEGDLVVAKIKSDPKFPTLGIGYIVSISSKNVVIQVEEDYIPQIDPKFKPENGIIRIAKTEISKPLEIFYDQIASRVGKTLGAHETEDVRESFIRELKEMNIVPAGRVLYGAGSGTKVTYFNCFVMPMPKDSREGISTHRQQVMEIMSRGGGVGTNGSTLRPKNTIAKTVGGKSSGAVSWLNDLASLTDLVQQGGSRRGAQMIMLQDWHPDIIEFIISKMQKPEILKWISDNFKHETIRTVAQEKLQFVPLDHEERDFHNEIIELSKNEKLLEKSRRILNEGGKYRVVSPEFLSGANISVGITKEFMEAVKEDIDYNLKFPDIENMTTGQKKFYDDNWHDIGDVREWERLGYPVRIYRTIKARELWDLINFCATYSAEPGVFFIDRANEMTNAAAYGQKVVCTNPCGEQPLAPYSVCNLAAINLANFVNKSTGEILWTKLENTVRTCVRLQDNIIDETPYFLEANEIQAKGERRLGLGIMGLHDLLIWHGVRYGSPKSIKVIDKLFKAIAVVAYVTSAELAEEKGAFGFLNQAQDLLQTGFISTLPERVHKSILKHGGLRNSHLLTIAPTGSTGTMVGVSTGLEPYFAFKYYRSGRLGKFIEVDQKIVAEWKEIHNHRDDEKLPPIFVSAMDLSPEEHADVQAAIQRWIDSSISKTVNAPKGYTVKQVEKIYQRLYEKGAKGGTVYVDGSRDAQVLSISNGDEDKREEIIVSKSTEHALSEIAERHETIPGNKFQRKIGTDVGDICPVCKEGIVEEIGGCNTCTNCGAQLKCGI